MSALMASMLYPQIFKFITGGTVLSKHFRILFAFSILMGLSTTAMAQDCGVVPTKPAVVDGASSSMEQIIENSNEVKTYIAEADLYLDCHAAWRQLIAFRGLSRDEKDAIEAEIKIILDERNAIGDDFNAEVQAFRAANPDL